MPAETPSAEMKLSPEHPLLGKSIAIIGGGPAGAFSAYLLAKQGVDVHIFEDRSPRLPDIANGERRILCTGCAGWLQEDARNLLAANGLVIPQSIIQAETKVTKIIMPDSDAAISLNISAATVFRGTSPLKQFEAHPQVESFDAWLLQSAIDAGARHHQVRITDINLNVDNQGKVRITDSNGNIHDKDLVIGAFGHNPDLMGTIRNNSGGESISLDMPISQRAGVREYFVPQELLSEDLLKSAYVFANPSGNILFGAIYPKGVYTQEPKGMYVTIALMGRGDIQPGDFRKFLENEQVKSRFKIDDAEKPSCACSNLLTLKSPRRFIQLGRKGTAVMINIGDSGPTRPRKNGIGAALDSAKHLSDILLQHGASGEGMKLYKRYIDETYVWDNYAVDAVMKLSDFVLNHELPRRAVIYLNNNDLFLLSKAARSTIEHILTGKSPYWRIPIDVLKETFGSI